MVPVIDFHSHVFPALLDPYLNEWGVPEERWQIVRNSIRGWLRPFLAGAHRIQPSLRHLSKDLRKAVDPIAMASSLPGLFLESTPEDLEHVMQDAEVSQTVVIAHPPHCANEWLLDLCQTRTNWIPAVQIPDGTADAGAKLREYIGRGAKILKIHAAADGGPPDSATYRELLEVAQTAQLPVILHTGCIHAKYIYKNPEMGRAELFENWFETYPELRFVLAHMNFHEPYVAIDLCERYPNLMVDTSWQPSEMIGEAVRRIGSDRVLFGSDWPFLGNNMKVGIERVRDCVSSGLFEEYDARLVLGGNAARLLGLSVEINKEAHAP